MVPAGRLSDSVSSVGVGLLKKSYFQILRGNWRLQREYFSRSPFRTLEMGARLANVLSLSFSLFPSLPPSYACVCTSVGVFPSTGTCGGQSLAADLPPLPLTLFFWIKFSQLNPELTGFLASLSGPEDLGLPACATRPDCLCGCWD